MQTSKIKVQNQPPYYGYEVEYGYLWEDHNFLAESVKVVTADTVTMRMMNLDRAESVKVVLVVMIMMMNLGH